MECQYLFLYFYDDLLTSTASLYFCCFHLQVTIIVLKTSVRTISEIKCLGVYCIHPSGPGLFQQAQQSLILWQMTKIMLSCCWRVSHHVNTRLSFSTYQMSNTQVAFSSCPLSAVLEKLLCDRQIAISGAALSYANYIFNSSGLSTLFP